MAKKTVKELEKTVKELEKKLKALEEYYWWDYWSQVQGEIRAIRAKKKLESDRYLHRLGQGAKGDWSLGGKLVSCEICRMRHTTKHHVDGLEKSKVFMAIITRHYVREPWHVKEAELVSALKKPMIACVEKGVDWEDYKRFPWVKVIEFDRDHFDIKEIEKELGPFLTRFRENLEG